MQTRDTMVMYTLLRFDGWLVCQAHPCLDAKMYIAESALQEKLYNAATGAF